MANDTQATTDEAAIKHTLQGQGAGDSLAGAIADAAQTAGLNRRQVSYEGWDHASKTIYVDTAEGTVPEVLHERLTGMGFEPVEKYDPHSDDGPHGCKYEDTRY